MKSLLLVIDLQNAFINKKTQNLPQKIEKIIKTKKYNEVAFTKFINSKDSIFVKKLNYNRCLDSDDVKIVIDTGDNKVINKTIYSTVNAELIKFIKEKAIDKIFLCGIDTECCILKTAFDLFELGYDVYVLKDYCGCTHGKIRHNNALNILKRNIGKDYVI